MEQDARASPVGPWHLFLISSVALSPSFAHSSAYFSSRDLPVHLFTSGVGDFMSKALLLLLGLTEARLRTRDCVSQSKHWRQSACERLTSAAEAAASRAQTRTHQPRLTHWSPLLRVLSRSTGSLGRRTSLHLTHSRTQAVSCTHTLYLASLYVTFGDPHWIPVLLCNQSANQAVEF